MAVRKWVPAVRESKILRRGPRESRHRCHTSKSIVISVGFFLSWIVNEGAWATSLDVSRVLYAPHFRKNSFAFVIFSKFRQFRQRQFHFRWVKESAFNWLLNGEKMNTDSPLFSVVYPQEERRPIQTAFFDLKARICLANERQLAPFGAWKSAWMKAHEIIGRFELVYFYSFFPRHWHQRFNKSVHLYRKKEKTDAKKRPKKNDTKKTWKYFKSRRKK